MRFLKDEDRKFNNIYDDNYELMKRAGSLVTHDSGGYYSEAYQRLQELGSLKKFYNQIRHEPLTAYYIQEEDGDFGQSEIIQEDFYDLLRLERLDEDAVLTEAMFVCILEDKLDKLYYSIN